MRLVRHIVTIFFLFDSLICYCQADFELLKSKMEFYKYMRFSKNFHDKNQLKCKYIGKNFLIWEQKDTTILDFKKIFLFTNDTRLDSIKLDTIFTSADYDFIYDQFKDNMTPGGTWVHYNSWKIINQNKLKTNRDSYWEFSVPLFSKEYDKCLVKIEYNLSNRNGYDSCIFLFIKTKKGIWTESVKFKCYYMRI
jgi:hypothetical protein